MPQEGQRGAGLAEGFTPFTRWASMDGRLAITGPVAIPWLCAQDSHTWSSRFSSLRISVKWIVAGFCLQVWHRCGGTRAIYHPFRLGHPEPVHGRAETVAALG